MYVQFGNSYNPVIASSRGFCPTKQKMLWGGIFLWWVSVLWVYCFPQHKISIHGLSLQTRICPLLTFLFTQRLNSFTHKYYWEHERNLPASSTSNLWWVIKNKMSSINYPTRQVGIRCVSRGEFIYFLSDCCLILTRVLFDSIMAGIHCVILDCLRWKMTIVGEISPTLWEK